MNRPKQTHCNSTGRPPHAKRFELSLEQLQQLLETADWQPTLKPARQGQTLGEELGVPGFGGEQQHADAGDLGLSNLEPLAHFSLTGQVNDRGFPLAGLVICRAKQVINDE